MSKADQIFEIGEKVRQQIEVEKQTPTPKLLFIDGPLHGQYLNIIIDNPYVLMVGQKEISKQKNLGISRKELESCRKLKQKVDIYVKHKIQYSEEWGFYYQYQDTCDYSKADYSKGGRHD